MYRRDLLEKHRLPVPATMDEYLRVVRALDEAERGHGIRGTTGQLRAGHYSLTCDWTAWLWAHGGSVFDRDGFFSGGDADGRRGLAYMLDLVRHMPDEARTWTWTASRARSPGRRRHGHLLGRVLPGFDGGDSRVAGLLDAARPPVAAKLRPPEQAGFLEVPHIGHQGGSSICVSRYSRHQEAAWIFMQWVCSKDVSALGRAQRRAAAVRRSTIATRACFTAAKVGPGTTGTSGHRTIENAMGTEPSCRPEIANAIIRPSWAGCWQASIADRLWRPSGAGRQGGAPTRNS
jgi:multiple sugar transport system substrate-binding protein